MIPAIIPINREEDNHTHFIGKFGNNDQFMGFVVANLEKYTPDDWQRFKKWYAVLYLFNQSGKLKDYKIEYFGTTADGERDVTKRAMENLRIWLNQLTNLRYSNMHVQLFKIVHEGAKFGLYTTEELGYFDPKEDPPEIKDQVHLLPNDIVFYPPWTGEYDT